MLLFARIRFRVHVFYHGLGRNIEFRISVRCTFVRGAIVCRRGGVPTMRFVQAPRYVRLISAAICKDTFQNACVLPWFRSQYRVSCRRKAHFCVGCPGVSPRWRANHAFRVGATLWKFHSCCYCICKATFQNSCVLPWFGSQHRVSYKRAAYFCEGCHCVSPGWRANYAFRVGATLRKVDFCCYLQGYVSEVMCFTMF